MNKTICDVCGHFWQDGKSDTCSICGTGSPVEMGGKLDTRKETRKRMVKKIVQESVSPDDAAKRMCQSGVAFSMSQGRRLWHQTQQRGCGRMA